MPRRFERNIPAPDAYLGTFDPLPPVPAPAPPAVGRVAASRYHNQVPTPVSMIPGLPYIEPPSTQAQGPGRYRNSALRHPGYLDYDSTCLEELRGGYPSVAAVQTALEQLAQQYQTTERLVWYRWGNSQFELDRVNLTPAFLRTNQINFGADLAGKGLYVCEDPSETCSYGDRAGTTAALVQVSVPAGTPVLDFTNYQVINAVRDLGFTNPINTVYECNPKVMVKFTLNAWVLKESTGVLVERFDGKYLSTTQLFQYHQAGAISTAMAATRDAYWNDLVRDSLKYRIYHPTIPQQIRIPLTAVEPLRNWSAHSHPRLSSLDPQQLIRGQNVQHFWRYDGSCGEYYHNGAILSQENVDRNLCRTPYPTQYVRTFPPTGEVCHEVVQNERNIKIGPVDLSLSP